MAAHAKALQLLRYESPCMHGLVRGICRKPVHADVFISPAGFHSMNIWNLP